MNWLKSLELRNFNRLKMYRKANWFVVMLKDSIRPPKVVVVSYKVTLMLKQRFISPEAGSREMPDIMQPPSDKSHAERYLHKTTLL